MADLSVNESRRDSRDVLSALARSGIAAGVSDFIFASVANGLINHRTPIRVFQGVTSVPFGRGALNGGTRTFLLGVAIHFCVAFFWSAVYLLLTRGVPSLGRLVKTPAGALIFAAVYGPIIWLVMTFIVIPAFVHRPPTISAIWWVNLFGHIPFIVLPMVWASGDGRGSRQ